MVSNQTELIMLGVMKILKEKGSFLLNNKKIIPFLILIVLTGLPIIQFFGNYNYLIHIVLFSFLYITMSSSWNIIGGYGGFISLGHNVFFGIGAYFSGFIFVRYGISPFITALIAGLVAALFGFVVGFITLRVKGPSYIISSIALLMIFRILFDRWELVGGTHGMTLPHNTFPVEWSKIPHYYALLFLMVFSIYLSWYIRHSKFGLALRSISHDEIKSEVTGINVKIIKVTAYALSAYFIGAAGAIWGDYLTYVRPNIFFIILIAANMVLMCILGGKGTVTGPIIGTIVMIFFNEFILAYFGATELNIFFTGFLMIITLMYFPEGIVGSLKKRKLLPGFLDWG